MPILLHLLFFTILPAQVGDTTRHYPGGDPTAEPRTGLLVVAHGAGSDWNHLVRETVRQVRWSGPVSTAFLMGAEARTAGFSQGVETLVREGAREIIVVPLMVSSHGSHYRQIRHYAGELEEMPAELQGHDHGGMPPRPVPMRVTAALDDAKELGAALAMRWRALDPTARARPLFLVAHGPNAEDETLAWLRNIDRALSTPELAPPARGVGLLRDDAPPPVRAEAVAAMRAQILELARVANDSVTVLPLLISSGQITAQKIPADLDGLPIRYVRTPLAPAAPLARWIERVGALAMERNAR